MTTARPAWRHDPCGEFGSQRVALVDHRALAESREPAIARDEHGEEHDEPGEAEQEERRAAPRHCGVDRQADRDGYERFAGLVPDQAERRPHDARPLTSERAPAQADAGVLACDGDLRASGVEQMDGAQMEGALCGYYRQSDGSASSIIGVSCSAT